MYNTFKVSVSLIMVLIPCTEKYSNEGLPIPPINELYERDIPIEIMERYMDMYATQ